MSTEPPPKRPLMGEAPAGAVLVDFSEMALIDAYREAIKGGLAALNGVADKVLAAAFSLATALAAVIGLVSPKDEPGPLAVVLPFVAFAVAAIAALVALLFHVNPADQPTSSQITKPIRDALNAKKLWVTIAVAVLGIGTGIGIKVVMDAYGPDATTQAAAATVVAVTPETGSDAISAACPGSNGSVTGTLDLATVDDAFIVVDVATGECGATPTTLRIPKDQVRAITIPG